MAQLVEYDRGEKEDARDDTERYVLGRTPAGMICCELRAQGECNQEKDDEPAGVQVNGDAKDLAQAKAGSLRRLCHRIPPHSILTKTRRRVPFSTAW